MTEQPVGESSELRALSPRARATVDALTALGEALGRDPLMTSALVSRPHPMLLMVRRGANTVLVSSGATWDNGRELFSPYADRIAAYETRLILLGRPTDPDLAQALNLGLAAIVAPEPSVAEISVALHQAFELMDVKARSESRGKWLNRYRYELGELIEIARALTTEREIGKLLALILEKSRFVTGADAGSMYVIDGTDHEITKNLLRFKTSQNDSVKFDSREFTMPISPRSMAGWVALEKKSIRIDDVYEMPKDSTFGFDRSFDQKVGYRTKSMLCTPLITKEGQVIGVLQLINKKREPSAKLLSPEDTDRLVVPFDDRSEQLMQTLASQAGIALENAMLYDEIRTIFEGFVRASVDAIEQRDPTTSGHSRRVAELTVGLAHAVERTDAGPYKDVSWKREDINEIEYASLLHDFGKIGVREHVLIKAKKLYPHELVLLKQRFDFVRRSIEVDLLSKKLALIERGGSAAELGDLDRELNQRLAELDDSWATVNHANEPTVLAAGDFKKIEDLAKQTFATLDGGQAPLLSPEEVKSLSVMRGSLTAEEFDEIRSHVTHTYRFLSKIPWGKTFARVAIIAGAHHERLNGTGYPNRWRAEEIPLQSKMMTISDIFDALTASDRPYKRAVPVDKALHILELEVKDGHIDTELVRIFRDAKVWEQIMGALY
ncbi:MAG: GAF domain-containing protein [Myxococcales bacterium]|nr:GAF domain-containing protein [Myxococcales bacterium]